MVADNTEVRSRVDGANGALHRGMTFFGRTTRKAVAAIFLVTLLILSTSAFAQNSNQTALLVEVFENPTCAGLDCPPWHVAPDFEVCLKAGDKLYFGFYSANKWPWAKKVDLHKLEGQAVQIQVSDKTIRIVSPQMKVKLKRTYGAGGIFRIQSCKDAHAS